jgi:hypothetical protein
MKRSTFCFSAIFLVAMVNCASGSAASRISVSIDPPSVQANMGDKITFAGTITNNSDKALDNIIVYISLANVSQGKEAPMDLEDWSANKAIKVDSIPPHGTYEGRWPMRLIDSGNYAVYITVVDKNDNSPVTSAISRLEVTRILRLNPNNVLPVAVGEPVLLGIVFVSIALKRRNKVNKPCAS